VDKDGKPPTHPNQRFYDQKTGRLVQRGLKQMVKMFPTPTARDWRSGRASDESMLRNARPLSEVVVKLVPTPNAGSSHWSGDPREWGGSGTLFRKNPPPPGSGHLNVAWVSKLMGYPERWVRVTDGNADSHD